MIIKKFDAFKARTKLKIQLSYNSVYSFGQACSRGCQDGKLLCGLLSPVLSKKITSGCWEVYLVLHVVKCLVKTKPLQSHRPGTEFSENRHRLLKCGSVLLSLTDLIFLFCGMYLRKLLFGSWMSAVVCFSHDFAFLLETCVGIVKVLVPLLAIQGKQKRLYE